MYAPEKEVRRDRDLCEDATDPVSSDAAALYLYLSIYTHICLSISDLYMCITIYIYTPKKEVRHDLDLSDDATDIVSSEAAAVYLYLSSYTYTYVHR